MKELNAKYWTKTVTMKKSLKQAFPIFDKSSLFNVCVFLYTLHNVTWKHETMQIQRQRPQH